MKKENFKNIFQIKNLIKIFIIILLFIIYVYICFLSSIPKEIILLEGQQVKDVHLFGISMGVETLSGNNNKQSDNSNKVKYSFNLFEKIKLKNVEVTTIPKTKVIPLGNSIGLKIYTKGILIVGITNVEGIDNKSYKPCENLDIKQGDIIVEVNSKKVEKVSQLVEIVNESKGQNLSIKCISDNSQQEKIINVTPVEVSGGQFRLGVWVRDVAAGVGTLTFYNPETNQIAALGHGISDIDTEEIIKIDNGEITSTRIVSIEKGEKGKTGIMKGVINENTIIGQISKNSDKGIFGSLKDKNKLKFNSNKMYELAQRNEIKVGDAKILCQLDGEKVEEYSIKIEKIYQNNNTTNKSMVIRVTDEKLIEKTGGIIQGMSGSPIIQNGKLVGAVTHVLLENPQKGYAIFADMMLKEMSMVD